ncbi:unnamed protein product [Linum trigynum]|uniref:Uncharacterized protein n=1 Tax=Linum trigynum TaxID=586398 RepID=A0AAV2FBN1_9ROSI
MNTDRRAYRIDPNILESDLARETTVAMAAIDATTKFLNKAVKPVLVDVAKLRVAKNCDVFVKLADACGYALDVIPSGKG